MTGSGGPASAPAPASAAWEAVAPGVFVVHDTCEVYVIVGDGGRTATCVDFGSGDVLDLLPQLGVEAVTDIVMTHHHRDQGQGLPRAAAVGIRIHVPPVEQELFRAPDRLWEERDLDNDYNVRQDRFSIVDRVPVASVVSEYLPRRYGDVTLRAIPTPGHTVGSVTYLLQRGGTLLAFTGDLIYAPGKVWSMASTQWSYSHHEGPAMVVVSCLLLADEKPDLLLPSHGKPIESAVDALEELCHTMQQYVDSRRDHPWDLIARLRHPYRALTPHLLRNESSIACSYVLLSETGEALMIDDGYDMTTGLPFGSDRAAKRPWLASLPGLRDDFGVTRITAALATHYHDDHVASLPLLRDVEGAELWIPENVAPILHDPWLYDLPCQWYEPIPADRVLPLGESVRWNEYEIITHALPGHTEFAAAFEVEVDGVRVLFTGDQQTGQGVTGFVREFLNYQYRNRLGLDDFADSAALYRRVAPGLMATGHWEPREVDSEYLDLVAVEGDFVRDIHRALLPLDEVDLGPTSVAAIVKPYRARTPVGGAVSLSIEVKNPFDASAPVRLEPVVAAGWSVSPQVVEGTVPAGEWGSFPVSVTAPGTPVLRGRVVVDVTIGALRLGQHCEAIVHVEAAG